MDFGQIDLTPFVDPNQLVGAGPEDWVAYRFAGNLGMGGSEGTIAGASGYDTYSSYFSLTGLYTYYIAYEMDLNGQTTQSAPTVVRTGRYDDYLRTPTVTANADGTFTLGLSGTYIADVNGTGEIVPLFIDVYDGDFGDDDLLDVVIYRHAPLPGVFDGLLLWFETSTMLFRDPNEYIAGDLGSSGETTAEVYQHIDGWSSASVSVPS